jgi:hypothetical protein
VALVDEILKKTQSYLDLVTIPKDLLPEIDGQVQALDDFIRAQAQKAPERVQVLDFAAHAENFKELQAERGKFARSLYSEDAKPTSLCLTLLSLFLQDCILETMK